MHNFKDEFLSEIHNRKGDVADAVGMPESKDYERLVLIISTFNKKYPGELAKHVALAKRNRQADKSRKKKMGALTYGFALPEPLYRAIEKEFPSLFRSKKHSDWFIKNFPGITQ